MSHIVRRTAQAFFLAGGAAGVACAVASHVLLAAMLWGVGPQASIKIMSGALSASVASIAVHEVGHILCALAFGVRIRPKLGLSCVGLVHDAADVARLSRVQRVALQSAGIWANVLFAAALYAFADTWRAQYIIAQVADQDMQPLVGQELLAIDGRQMSAALWQHYKARDVLLKLWPGGNMRWNGPVASLRELIAIGIVQSRAGLYAQATLGVAWINSLYVPRLDGTHIVETFLGKRRGLGLLKACVLVALLVYLGTKVPLEFLAGQPV